MAGPTHPTVRTLEAFPGAALAWTDLAPSPDPARLTAAERALYAAFTTDKRRSEWWSGRQAAHAALGALGGGELSVLADPRGVPRLEGLGADRLFVSITHGRRVAAAVACRTDARFTAVGVDVVDAEDGDRVERLAARVLTPLERGLVAADPRAALLAWGTREAIAKATSTGMFMFALSGAPMLEVDAAAGRIRTALAGIEVAFEPTRDGGVLVLAGATAAAVAHARARAGLAAR